MRHYDVPLIGGVVLHRGIIAEMTTGEGKTLVTSSARYPLTRTLKPPVSTVSTHTRL